MIYNFCYNNGDRQNVINYLKDNKKTRVLDIGYSANSWDTEYVTHYVDVIKSDETKIGFLGDINFPYIWEEVAKDVEVNGKFDFCICSHTLEDIINPLYVSQMINKFCLSGFIAVPSKFIEMTKWIDGQYRGYIHHRYIFNYENDKLVGYPKLNFIEYDIRFNTLANQLTPDNRELQFFWKDKFDLEIINANYMGPNVNAVLNYYNSLLK